MWITSPELNGEALGNSRIQTVYCHLDETIVSVGMHVEQGQIIGHEGNRGMVVSGGNQYWGNAPAGVGTHPHFGLYEDIKVGGLWFRRHKNVLRDSIEDLGDAGKSRRRHHGRTIHVEANGGVSHQQPFALIASYSMYGINRICSAADCYGGGVYC